MNKLWVINLDILEEFYTIVDKVEKNIGQKLNSHEMEVVFLEVMKINNIKVAGRNELTKIELLKELADNGKKILNVDENGFTFIKKKEK